MNDEDALLAAIVAHPGEDTPRLAYADWLEENEAPIQADFIRTQCRLASGSAADPDYPDLLERYAEIVANFQVAVKMTAPPLPPGFTHRSEIGPGSDNFRRGFLHAVHGQWGGNQMTPEEGEVDEVCAGLGRLVATTTARKLDLDELTPDQLARVLASPGAEALTGLAVSPNVYEADGGDAILQALARAKSVAGLEELHLHLRASAAGLAALAGVTFERLAHIDLPMLQGRVRDLAPLTRAPWFQGLRSVRAGGSDAPLESALLAALAKLPRLESLDLRFQHPGAMKALGSARGFRSLASLALWATPSRASAHLAHLARGKFPRLAELTVYNLWPGQLTALLAARWFPQVRVLNLPSSALTDRSLVALARSGAAPNLRILRIADTSLGKTAFSALADGTRFPELTTLDLGTGYLQAVKPANAAWFAAGLSLPRLRHLNLNGWRLGDDGAAALAANRSLANLTRLSLAHCGIGDRGLGAIVRAPHLQQLIELDVSYNNLKRAAALLDVSRLPRLATVRLDGNGFTRPAREKLHRARGWRTHE